MKDLAWTPASASDAIDRCIKISFSFGQFEQMLLIKWANTYFFYINQDSKIFSWWLSTCISVGNPTCLTSNLSTFTCFNQLNPSQSNAVCVGRELASFLASSEALYTRVCSTLCATTQAKVSARAVTNNNSCWFAPNPPRAHRRFPAALTAAPFPPVIVINMQISLELSCCEKALLSFDYKVFGPQM